MDTLLELELIAVLVGLLGTIGGGIMGYARLQSRVGYLEEQMDELKSDHKEHDHEIQDTLHEMQKEFSQYRIEHKDIHTDERLLLQEVLVKVDTLTKMTSGKDP